MKYKCPMCQGIGKIEKPHNLKILKAAYKKNMTKKLRKEGYSIRQIMLLLDYKSPASVQFNLKK